MPTVALTPSVRAILTLFLSDVTAKLPAGEISDRTGVTHGTCYFALRALLADGFLEWELEAKTGAPRQRRKLFWMPGGGAIRARQVLSEDSRNEDGRQTE